MNDPIGTWEDEGGSTTPTPPAPGMIGTLNQITWAVQIKSQVNAEFDRLRNLLEYAMRKQSPEDLIDIEAILRIVEDKRAEVLENNQAGYFIRNWQELGNQVSRMIVADPRYQAIKASQTARFQVARSINKPKFHP